MRVFNQRETRYKRDLYPTPSEALDFLKVSGELNDMKGERIWEPASGYGHISRFLEKEGFKVDSSDIGMEEEIYGRKGVDFLTHPVHQHVDNIVTNPPYREAQEFLEKAISIARHKVIMLMRVGFLTSMSRYELFSVHPPSKVIIISSRLPHWNNESKTWKRDGSFNHAFICYDQHSMTKETKLEWVG